MTYASTYPRVLLADGKTGERKDLHDVLRKLSGSLDIISSTEDLLKSDANNQYDIIVIDSELPQFELLNWLELMRANSICPPIVVVKDQTDLEETINLFRAGVSDVLMAPVHSEMVKESIKRLLRDKAAAQHSGQFFQGLEYEKKEYSFASYQIGNLQFTLSIFQKLEKAGIIDNSLRLRIELAFQEAITNSLDHGNLELNSTLKDQFNADGIDQYQITRRERLTQQPYKDRKIIVSTEYNGKKISISIKDEGKGFDYSRFTTDISDPTANCHGRGLPILYAVMDEVSYSQGGTEITLVKLLDDSGKKVNGK